ncbi:hypothetical protein SLE2022_093260 [Rubroshorea leprosula]
MGHRRWLEADHIYRQDAQSFDGTCETRPAPMRLTGSEALRQLECIQDEYNNGSMQPWKRKSQQGKSKDNYKARCDLEDMGIRNDLHPKVRLRTNTKYLPKACYQMTSKEKDAFFKVLKDLRAPDELSSNVSHCVQLKPHKLIGLKSHDCHVLMLELLPIALRKSLPDEVCSTVIDFCNYFKNICSKVLCERDLELLEHRIAITLCEMEKIFPPSFFTIMVLLAIHLANEAKLGGPVNFRWMYPIERELFTLKSYVRNPRYPEGSIAEGYLAQECLTFCSRTDVSEDEDGVDVTPEMEEEQVEDDELVPED